MSLLPKDTAYSVTREEVAAQLARAVSKRQVWTRLAAHLLAHGEFQPSLFDLEYRAQKSKRDVEIAIAKARGKHDVKPSPEETLCRLEFFLQLVLKKK